MSDVADEYKSSLAELNFNSKPHINMLTMIAEENIKHAPLIVQTIVDHINSVPSEMMLPCMYLIDSIIKNIGKVFVQLFSKHIVAIFTSVFEKVDENVRSLLYKLRSTWTGIFPNALLLRLDRSVQSLDPAWPILAQAPPKTTIHVNPKFLDKPAAQAPKKVEDPSSLLHEANELKKKQLEVLQILQAKKQQLLELQKKASATVAASEVLGADVQKALNARDPRLSRKEKTNNGSPLPSVVVVPKESQASKKREDTAPEKPSSPEPKRMKLDNSEPLAATDLRNKLRDSGKSGTTPSPAEPHVDKTLSVESDTSKRKKPVNSDTVPYPKMSNKVKVPVTESDHLAVKQNIVNSQPLLNEPVVKFRDAPEVPKGNAKLKEEDLYQTSSVKEQVVPNPVLFGSEDKDYRTFGPPKADADERQLHKEIAFTKRLPPPMVKSFKLDNKERKVYFVDDRAFAVMDDNLPHELKFEGPPKSIFIEGLPHLFELGFHGEQIEFELEGKRNTLKFGTPAREVYINGYPYEAQFGGEPLIAMLEDGKLHRIHISGPPPQVILDDVPAFELYDRFCQSNQDFLRTFNHQPQEITPDLHHASMDIDMRVTTNNRVSTTVFNFPLDKVNDVDWKRMTTSDSSHVTWEAPRNSFETAKVENHAFMPHRTFPDRPADWDGRVPVHEVQNQNKLIPPLLPPAPLLNRFPLSEGRLFKNDPLSFSVSESSSMPPSSGMAFQHPEYPNSQFNQHQFANAPRLPPPPLPPFLSSVACSTSIPSCYVNTIVTAPKPIAPLAPPPMPAPSLMAPICTPALSKPVPLPVESSVPVPVTSAAPLPVTQPTTVPQSQPEPPATKSAPLSSIDRFLENLIAAGVISKRSETPPPSESEKTAAEIPKEEPVKEVPIPVITFDSKCLKEFHRGVVNAFHTGSQCAICGMRYKEMQSEQYSRHLDWHFRMNRREKDGAKKPISRRLFFEISDWIEFKEIEEKDERAPSYFELQSSGQLSDEEPETVCSVPSTECESEVCAVCEEKFQLFWVEDEEEWHLRNAVKHEDQVYHPACYEDFKKAQEAEAKAKAEAEAKAKAEEEAKAKAEAEAAAAAAEAASKAEDEKEEEPMPLEAEDIKKEVEDQEQSEVKEEESTGTEVKEEPMDETEPPPEEKPKPVSEPKYKEDDVPMDSDEEGEAEFRPPTPDPRFQNLPPVIKGTELSALCSIM